MKEVGVDGDRPSDTAAGDVESNEDEEEYPEESTNSDLEDAATAEPTTQLTVATYDKHVAVDRFGNDVSVSQLQLGDGT